MDSPSNPPTRPLVLALIAVLGCAAMGVGGWLALSGTLASVPPAPPPAKNAPAEEPGDTRSIEQPEKAVRGRKPPEKFGFPSYPTAMEFQSMEIGQHQGSAAYSVKQGTADEISRFYIEKLGADGWQFDWKREAEVHPKDMGKEIAMKGTRIRWVRRKDQRQLTLLTLDDPQEGRSAQAVLSWSPLKPRRRKSATE